MRKWIFRIAPVAIAAMLTLAACGGEGDGADTDEAAATPATVTIGYNRFLESSFGSGAAPIEVIRTVVAEAHPEITVDLNVLPDTVGGMRDAIAVWMLAGDGTVDIYGMDTPWVSEFGTAGWAVDLTEELPGLEERFVDSGLETYRYDGALLAVPFWGSISGLYYRTDFLEEYGFGVPETYDDLVAISETITADRPELTAFAWPGAQEEALVMVFADFLYGFGGSYRDAAGDYAFDSPEAVEALTFMRELVSQGVSPAETSAWTGEEARRRFVDGQGLFLWHNSDLVTWLDDPERSQVAGKWDFTTTPAQPNGRKAGVTGGFAFAINPHTDTPDATRAVLSLIASEEVQKGFALAWGPVQYYDGLYEQEEVLAANPNADRITPVLDHALSRPPSTEYAQLSAILQEELHAALTDRKTPEEALASVSRRVADLQ
ncbi:MAG: extracellular solute-binding protein [bacterium]